MRVSDVLKSNRQTLATCIPEESIVSISKRLSSLHIGAFPVCDAHGTLVESFPSATSCAASPRKEPGWPTGTFTI